jgi:hypothetical protein
MRVTGILDFGAKWKEEVRCTLRQIYPLVSIAVPLLWSSGQSSWLQIQGSGFHSRCYQILREVVGPERGRLSLVSITKELLGRKVAAAV